MSVTQRKRRLIAAGIVLGLFLIALVFHEDMWRSQLPASQQVAAQDSAQTGLAELEIKGRASKTNYSREQFGSGWSDNQGCDMRNIILNRDLTEVTTNQECQVVSGQLNDPYTGKNINFQRGSGTSQAVQIDHVVALSNAWQTGAQQMSPEERERFANDPLELLAVDGEANRQKSAGDAATWLPSNKIFRCQYVARQIGVKAKYQLWVTPPEHAAMTRILQTCPGQALPVE